VPASEVPVSLAGAESLTAASGVVPLSVGVVVVVLEHAAARRRKETIALLLNCITSSMEGYRTNDVHLTDAVCGHKGIERLFAGKTR
jgi:hypothetical protein